MVAFLTTLICTLVPIFYFCQDYAVGTDIKYVNCGPNTIVDVDMAPCLTQPCVFQKGTNATVTIDFNTTQQDCVRITGHEMGGKVVYSSSNGLICPIICKILHNPLLGKKPVDEITTKVYGIVAGIPIPYQLPKANGCEGCNLLCPLQPGTNKYINVFPVLQNYPDIGFQSNVCNVPALRSVTPNSPILLKRFAIWFPCAANVLRLARDTAQNIKLEVKWELVNKKGDQLVCFVFPMEIVG